MQRTNAEAPAANGRDEGAGDAPSPKFSVVVPTYERPEMLSQTLDRLTPERQRVPARTYEIIVTDDSRNDATEVMVRHKYPDVRYVRGGRRRGPATNRNRGAAAARGEWIAFLDDDCRPVDGWLAALEHVDATLKPDVIEGAILAPDKVDSPFRHYVENLTGDLYWSPNLAVRRVVFNRLGGFDEDFLEAAGDDLEFGERIRRSGVSTVYCPTANVIHPAHVASLRYIFWHAFTIRWHLLYLLKTRQGVPLDAPMWRALSYLVGSRSINLLRLTWKSLQPSEAARRRTALFNVGMSWLMFPIMLPYMAYWDLRFRRILRERCRRPLTPVRS